MCTVQLFLPLMRFLQFWEVSWSSGAISSHFYLIYFCFLESASNNPKYFSPNVLMISWYDTSIPLIVSIFLLFIISVEYFQWQIHFRYPGYIFFLFVSGYYNYYCFAHSNVFNINFSWCFFQSRLSNIKSPQVSWTLLSILVDLNNAVVWMISTHPLISKSPNPVLILQWQYQVRQLQLASPFL